MIQTGELPSLLREMGSANGLCRQLLLDASHSLPLERKGAGNSEEQQCESDCLMSLFIMEAFFLLSWRGEGAAYGWGIPASFDTLSDKE